MRIKAVRLENIRSHVDTRVTFEEGFNCLIGGLGAGKTSILYAIHFALFGEPLGRTFAYLLREDAGKGRVTLWFEHEGSEYVITRGLRRTGTGISQDLSMLKLYKNGRLIAERRVSSVREQLEKEIGIDEEIFRDVIWVRQEKLKELIDMSPRDRQKKLDKLLGLSDFEQAWSELRDYERDYKREKEIYERDPDVLMASRIEAEHAGLVEELAKISAEIEDLKLKVDEAREEEEEARKRLKELEEIRKEYERLREKKTSIEATIREANKTLKRLMADVEQARARIGKMEEEMERLIDEEMKHRRSLALIGLRADMSVEEAEEEFRKLEARIEELRTRVANISAEIREIENRLKLISGDTCPTCLRPIDEAHRQKLSTSLGRELLKKKHELAAAEEEMTRLQDERTSLSEAINGLKEVSDRKNFLKSRLEEEKELLERQERELDSTKMRIEMLKVELEALENRLSEVELTGLEEARQELERRTRKLRELENMMERLKEKKNLLKDRLADYEGRLKAVEEKKRKIERAAKLLEIVKLLRNAYRSVQPYLRTEVVRLARHYVQEVLNQISGPEGTSMFVEISQDYTPIVKIGGRERSINHLSGGERTLLALAYRIGMGQLVMQAKAGRSLDLLLLDEPTESLGREDLSIDRLADALSRLREVEQIIAVTHSEAFAEKANHVIRVERTDDVSHIRTERARPTS